MSSHAQQNGRARKRKESDRPRSRDWIATGIALVGLFLGIANFWIARRTRLDLQQQTVADILNQVSKALDELEDTKAAPGRSHNVTMAAVEIQLNRVQALAPASAQVRRLRVEHFWISGRPDQAIAYCQQAIRDIPDDSLLHGELGLMYQRTGQPAESVAAYNTALDLATEPTVVATVHQNLLLLHVTEGTTAAAIAGLRTRVGRPRERTAACAAIGHAFEFFGDLFSELQGDYQASCRSKGKP